MMFRTLLSLPFVALLASAMPAAAMDQEAKAIGRCDIPSGAALYARSPSTLPSGWVTKTTSTTGASKALPEVMVDGWPARRGSATALLRELGKEAGFSVDAPASLPVVAWDGRKASLKSVVSSLAGQAGATWTFDGSTLAVTTVKPVANSTASFALPTDRDARLATMDILRAFDMDVSVSGDTVSLSGSPDEVAKARKTLSETRTITVLDVVFLRGRPLDGRYDWSALGAMRSSAAGAGGTFVFTDPEPETVIQRFVSKGDLLEDSAQSVAAPSGWGLAVPPSQCGVGSGEIIVTSKDVADKIDLKIEGSDLSAAFPGFVLGSTALSVASKPTDGWIRMVLVRPRTVTFSPR